MWELTHPVDEAWGLPGDRGHPPVGLHHRLVEARGWAEDAEEELVEAPGLIERAEFVRGVNARAAEAGSAQAELEALAEVVEVAQALYFRQRRLELAVLEAADGGARKTAIAAAAGVNRTSVYPWMAKARAFKEKLRADTRLDLEEDLGESLVCALCDGSFRMGDENPDDAYLAMHRHWTTSHGWDPLNPDEPDEPGGPEPDQPGGGWTTGRPRPPQAGEAHALEQAAAARSAVARLTEEHRLASIGGGAVTMLESFAERADKRFGALKAHIDRNRNESRLLAPVVAISRQVDDSAWMLELAMLRAETWGIKRAMVARAAGMADATVGRWAGNARALIAQMWAQTRLETGPTDERESFACGLCDTAFEIELKVDAASEFADLYRLDAYAGMYRHWRTSHTAARSETA